jgi:amino acid adenylation domain-containing protein
MEGDMCIVGANSGAAANKQAGGRELPLSFGQEQLWFLEELSPGTPTYNIAMLYRLEGPVDSGHLRSSLEWVVARHDVLRATFDAREGIPRQVIADQGPVVLFADDLTGLPTGEREPAALRAAAAEAATPFDLRTGPLYRVRLIRVAAERHLLSVVVHHIVSDGWSTGLLIAELSQAYAMLMRDETLGAGAPPRQYAEFVEAQRAALQDGLLEPHLAYWERQLSGLPVLDIPADRPRPALAGHRGAEMIRNLPADLPGRLRALGRRHGVSVYMVLAAAVGLVLSRYTGEEDIPIGTTMLGRTEPEFEQMLGFCVNMAVLRLDVAGDPTFAEFLDRVRDVVLEAFDHQAVPFEKVVHRLNVPRDPSRNPLFQACFQLLDGDTGGGRLSLPGLTVTQLNIVSGRSRFDLSLTFTDSSPGLCLAIEYSAEMYDAWRVEQLGRHVERVLSAAADDSSAHLSEMQLLTSAERRALLLSGTGPHDELPAQPVHVLVAEQAAAAPDSVAVVFEQDQMTYGELDWRADQLARYLRSLGVRHQDIVAIAIERGIEVLVAMLGVLKAGAAFLALDTEHPVNRLMTILDDAAVDVVLTRSDLLASLPEPAGRRYVCIDEDWLAGAAGLASQPLAEWASQDSLVYALYTSGSTGKPKGVLIEHRALVSYLMSFVEMFGLRPGDRMLQYASLTFDLSEAEIFSALIRGATLVFARRDTLLSADALAALMRRERITYIGAPPAMLALLEPEPYPDLRNVLAGGEACPPDLVNRWNLPGRKLVNGYGPTEAAIGCTMFEVPKIAWQSSPPIGGPLQHRRLYVVNRSGDLVPIGVLGELLIGGDEGLARGYLNRPDLTAERFIKDPFRLEGRVYRSGDLVRWTPDMQLEFIGRVDTQVKLRGLRIELGEIESVLARHPRVENVAVTLRQDAAGQQALACYLTATDGQVPSITELRAFLGQYLPSYMVPTAWTVLNAMPLSAAGKIDRAALPRPTSFAATERPVIAPESVAERHVAAAFAEVLNVPVDRLSVNDDFFELGGNSLQAMRVISRINKAFALDLGVRVLYGASRLRVIAELVDDLATVTPPEPDNTRLTRAEGPGTTAELIARIIGEVLPTLRSSSAVPSHANLYELGGDDSHAVAVLRLIAERTGVIVTERSLYCASTLTAAVEAERAALRARQQGSPAQKSLLVRLEAGNSDGPALFCVPGGSGSPFVYAGLARMLSPDRPVYGFEAPGPEHDRAPLGRVADLAAAFVASLGPGDPQRPRHLLGWSMGGLVAFEMARQLTEAGQPVGLLAVVDAQLPSGADVPTDWELTRQFVRDLAAGWALPVPELVSVLDDAGEQPWLSSLDALIRDGALPPEIDQQQVRHQLAVFMASARAAYTYRPGWVHPGRLTVIRTAENPTTAQDWAPLANEVTEHVIPSDHFLIWTPQVVPVLAAIIADCLASPGGLASPGENLASGRLVKP